MVAGLGTMLAWSVASGCSRSADETRSRARSGVGGAGGEVGVTGGTAGMTAAGGGTSGLGGGTGGTETTMGGNSAGGAASASGGTAGSEAPMSGRGGEATGGSGGSTSGGSGNTSGPPGIGGNWTVVFEDEFGSGTAPSSTQYNFYPVWGDNSNPQNDTAFRQGETHPTTGLGGLSASAATVSNGKALLTASDADTRYAGYDWPYRGAWIRTKEEYLYGYFEVRAKVAGGQGLWTTLWLMPDPYDADQAWEIDIAEFPGTGATRAHQNIHWGVFADGNQDLSNVPGDYSAAFHTYGVLWEPSRVRWYVDGALVKTHNAHVPNVPMQLICFLEVGGPVGWVGTFDGSTPLPRATEIEYLRIYRQP
jgi:hypothetical protein